MARLCPMVYFIIKCAISGLIIVVVSEVAKRSPAFGALFVSLPLVSLLAILWLWRDATCWRQFLAKHGRELRSDSYPLFHDSLVARQVRDQSMSGGATSDSAMKIAPICKAAILLVPLVWAHGAHAHGIAGNRYFDGTLTFDDPAVADEAILPYYETRKLFERRKRRSVAGFSNCSGSRSAITMRRSCRTRRPGSKRAGKRAKPPLRSASLEARAG